jgi:hypothetical protein
LSETEKNLNTADLLIGHLLNAKKKHDEDKNVESEEVQYLQKGADYLSTFLTQQGIQPQKTVTKTKPLGLEELKKEFVKNLVKNEFVTIDDDGRTLLTEKGKNFLNQQTRETADKVTLVQLKNLRFRRSLARKRNPAGRKTKNKRKTSVKKKKRRR